MQQLPAFFKLIRYQNLLMIAITQVLIRYAFFEAFHLDISLSHFQFFLLLISVLALAAAGNIINDIFDIKTDAINKPEKQIIGKKISENTAYNWFFGLNILSVGIGFYLSNFIGHPSFTALFILPSALLYLYSSHFKNTGFLGNIVISILVAMVILIVGIFDLFPAITPQNQQTQKVIFSILIDYGIFAFLINLLRELVKDQKDITGDYNTGRKSIPIVFGRNRCNNLIFFLTLLPLAGMVYYIYQYLFENQWAILYVFFLILIPLFYFLIRLPRAKTKKDFHHLSILLKLILATGVLSIGLYPLILL